MYSDGDLFLELNAASRQLDRFPSRPDFDRLSDRWWGTLDRRFGERRTRSAGERRKAVLGRYLDALCDAVDVAAQRPALEQLAEAARGNGRRQRHHITCWLQRLHAHGPIAKIPHTAAGACPPRETP